MQGKNMAAVVITAALTLLVVLVLGSLWWGSGLTGTVPLGMRGMMGGFGFGMPLWFGGNMMFAGLMMLTMLAAPVLVILGLVWLVVTLGRGSTTMPVSSGQTALDILKMRYARGEITKEQYDEMRQHIGT